MIAEWPLDEGKGIKVAEKISGTAQEIHRHFRWANAKAGGGLKMDGFTTYIEWPARTVPRLGERFSLSAWVAPQTYPWNWVALFDQEINSERGFLFGMDAEGHLGIELGLNGVWTVYKSQETLPLMQWSHVAVSVDSGHHVTLFIDGAVVEREVITGRFRQAEDAPLRIGRNLTDLPATALVRPKAAYPALYSYDGILCDLRIYSGAVSAAEVKTLADHPRAHLKPDLEARKWPVMWSKSSRLQAVYTSLNLYPEWDALWRTGRAADIVVTLPDSPVH